MKTVNIIGAGIAGLSAGCYLQMNGYKTRIFEAHNIPGGLCTAWKRGEYTFDGCIHWLVGANPKSKFYEMWSELIDMDRVKFHHHEEYMRVYDKDNHFIALYTDVDKLERELMHKAPEDANFNKEFVKSIRKLSTFNMDSSVANETMGIWDALKMMMQFLPYMPHFRKWNKKTKDIAMDLKNPLLKKTILNTFDPDMAFIFMIFTLAWMNTRNGGYPIGGSLMFARAIEKRYKELGGELFYKHRCEKITLVNQNGKARATGIQTSKGEEFTADITISAADGYDTIFNMLRGQFTDQKVESYYSEYLPFPSYLQVSFGIGTKMDNIPMNQMIPLEKPIQLGPTTSIDSLPLRFFNYDPTLAPEGKTIISMLLTTRDDDYWMKLRRNDLNKYQEEKDIILTEIKEALEKRFNGIKQYIEESDISTPATVIRYTNNWRGSYEGWILTPEIGLKSMKKTLPGLSNFYMIGHWVEPGGGLPTVLRSGRNVTQLICKKDKKKFTTSKAKSATPVI